MIPGGLMSPQRMGGMRKVIRPTPEVPATPPPSGLLLGTCDCEGVGEGVGGWTFPWRIVTGSHTCSL